MEQVNTAMSQVDQVTQRNASSSEELSSTAEELAAQAETLEQLMTFFRIDGVSQLGHRQGRSVLHGLHAAAPQAHGTVPGAATAGNGASQDSKAAQGQAVVQAWAGGEQDFQRF